MKTIYKVFTKDWTSPDGRYSYKKGDEELVFPEVKSNEFDVIGADVGVIYEVPKEYLKDKYYGQIEQRDNINESFRNLHKEIVDRIASWCKENDLELDDFSLSADGFEESCKYGHWVSSTDSSFSCWKFNDEYKSAFWDMNVKYKKEDLDKISFEAKTPYIYSM